MNPYEKTAEEMKRQSERPKRIAKSAIATASAIGASSFIPMLSRAVPFLSEYIPENLAIKGLSKISPKFGNFVKNAFDSGFDFQEVKNFIGEQINDSQKQQPPKENRNIIQQYSPELFQFLQGQIQKGNNPIAAGAAAQNNSKFSNIIKKISKDHKADWSSILQTVFGNEQQQQQPPSQQASQQEIFYDTQENQQQRQQQGQTSQTLMQALQLAAESRKRRQR